LIRSTGVGTPSGAIVRRSGGAGGSLAELCVVRFYPGAACVSCGRERQREKSDQHSVRVRDHFYVSACGRVGVKTPKPMAEFHVTGTTKTTSLDVDKNANVKGVLTINELTPMKGLLAAKTLRIDSSAQIKGKTQIDADLVVKGNLFVEKEVKMIGGGGSEESEMMMSRIALIEESHSTLMEHNKMLHSRVQELEKQLASR